jgi:transcription factor E2F7/8
MVTPTPKKPKLEHHSSIGSNPGSTSAYSRKKKSLGILAENFLKTYQHLPQGSTIVVDEAAVQLGVERRRIYDVVNILESICLVCKKHKNTYSWMGMEMLDAVFGRLQAQAIVEYPHDAKTFLGTTTDDSASVTKPLVPVPLKPPRRQSKTRENKSLAKLSQEFLQVFLVGHGTLSLPEASDKIQGTTSMEELIAMGGMTTSPTAATTPTITTTTTLSSQKLKDDNDPKELKAAAARGLKTKIRRLYDIANVFLSVGLLKKVDSNDSSRRPNFAWSYRLSAKALYDLHRPSNNETNNATAAPPPPQEESSPALTSCVSFVATSTNSSTAQQAQPVMEETCA